MADKKTPLPGTPEALEEYRKLKADIDAKLEAGRRALESATFADPPPEAPAEDAGSGDVPVPIYRGLRIESIDGEGRPYFRNLGHPPEGCPVTCLGRDGKVFYFLTPGGQLVSYEDGKFGRSHIAALFAGRAMDWLIRAYPQRTAQGRVKGFQADLAQLELFAACDAAGVFDAREKVRGLGCWRGENGELIQHLGDVVLIGDRREKPGMIDGFVYPGRPAVAPPLSGGIEASLEVYGDLLTWNWSRGGLDARLLLGWMGCAIMGAALDWRPMIFMTGDAGSGKSSVQERVKKLLPGRLASTVDATPAALRQIVNQDAIGVSFDEIEADMNTSQGTDVMKLARVAASGGTTYRGGKDHNASEFTLRGCFAFSAIVPPSMRVQDMQRLAFLRLGPLPKGGRMAEFTDAQLKTLGQKMAGRIAEGWARWPAVLRVFEEALIRLGHNQRGAKQFGTLLAAAELLTSDETPSDEVADNLARGLARDALYEYESADPTWLLVLRHVLSAQPEVWRNVGSPTVAEVIRSWMGAVSEEDRRREQIKLNRAGLALTKDRTFGQTWLAIPARHQQIQAMFSQTDFRAHGGEGTWTSSLRNADKWNPDEKTGVYRVESVPQLGRVKCTLIRLSATVTISGKTVPIFDEDPEKVGDEDPAA